MKKLRLNKIVLSLLPSLIIIIILFWGGFLNGLLQSFGLFTITGDNDFTFKYYYEVFNNKRYIESFLFTIRFSLITIILTTIFSLIVLNLLYNVLNKDSLKKVLFIKKLFTIPMFVPYAVSGYLIVLLFSRTGWFSSFAYNINLINNFNEFPILVNDKFGWGIIFTYIWKTSPFIILVNFPILLRINKSWLDAAKIFGCKKNKFFFQVVLPIILPSLLSSVFIIFAFIFSAFEIPFLLGVTYPKALPVITYEIFSIGSLADRPIAMVINTCITIITIFFGLLMYFINKRLTGSDNIW